jgi:hypothetical protein
MAARQSRPKPVNPLAPAKAPQRGSIVFEVRGLFRGELQDACPHLRSHDLHILEILAADAWYGRDSENYTWVSAPLSTMSYLSPRSRLDEDWVDAALIELQTAHLIAADGRRYTVYPLAHRFLGAERVGSASGICEFTCVDAARGLYTHRVDLASYARDYLPISRSKLGAVC